jgi:hypothetical protein
MSSYGYYISIISFLFFLLSYLFGPALPSTSPLHGAAYRGDLILVKQLIFEEELRLNQAGAANKQTIKTFINQKDNWNNTALHVSQDKHTERNK